MSKAAPFQTTMLRRPQVSATSGNSRSTLYRRIQDGLFVAPVKVGPRAVGWPSYEVESLNQARIASRSDAEIKRLVQKLHADRRKAG